MLSGQMYGNFRLKILKIRANFLKSDDMQCANNFFDSKRLQFIRMSSKRFVFTG